VIHSMAVAAVCASAEQVQRILDAYRELLLQDRSHLVAIIGSIAELRLSPTQKESFLDLVEGALALVDADDVPTVVQAMLSMATPATATRIILAIRTEATKVTLAIAALFAEPLAAAIRAQPFCSRAYFAQLRTVPPLSAMDLLASAALLEIPALRRAAADSLLAAVSLAPRPALGALASTLSSPAAGPSAVNLLSILLNPPPPPRPLRGGRAGAVPARLGPALRARAAQVAARSLLVDQPSLRRHALTALLATAARAAPTPGGPHAEALSGGAAAPGGPHGAGGAGGWRARIAAAAVLGVAAEERGRAALAADADLLLQLIALHGPVCDAPTLHLLAASLARLAPGSASAHAQAHARPAAGLGAALVVVQKLYFSSNAAATRAALVVTAHVLARPRLGSALAPCAPGPPRATRPPPHGLPRGAAETDARARLAVAGGRGAAAALHRAAALARVVPVGPGAVRGAAAARAASAVGGRGRGRARGGTGAADGAGECAARQSWRAGTRGGVRGGVGGGRRGRGVCGLDPPVR
jgi:hypothetical protein